MNLRLFVLVVLCLNTAAFVRADRYDFREPFRHTGSFASNGAVEIENVNGEIEILTWDRPEILIEGVKSAKTAEELQAIQLAMDVTDRNASVKVRLPKRSGGWFPKGTIRAAVRMTITVPENAALDEVRTVNGDIKAVNVRGDAQLETVNGTIRATGLGGDADLETVNGGIEVSFARLEAGQAMDFETVNGGVTVELPEDAGVAVRASVVNGGITCDFPLESTHSSGKRKLVGTVGDGRGTLTAETVNGGIHIKRR